IMDPKEAMQPKAASLRGPPTHFSGTPPYSETRRGAITSQISRTTPASGGPPAVGENAGARVTPAVCGRLRRPPRMGKGEAMPIEISMNKVTTWSLENQEKRRNQGDWFLHATYVLDGDYSLRQTILQSIHRVELWAGWPR